MREVPWRRMSFAECRWILRRRRGRATTRARRTTSAQVGAKPNSIRTLHNTPSNESADYHPLSEWASDVHSRSRRAKMPHHISDEMRRCIDECQSCAAICLESVPHCLELGGKHAAAEHIRTLLDCAEACQTAANFMLRTSDLHGRVCEVCAEVCERCAEECERFDDAQMRRCAEECRRCAESCRAMAKMGARA